MAEERFRIHVEMAGVAGVEADAKRVKRAEREMAGGTDQVTASMRRNESASAALNSRHADVDRGMRSVNSTIRDTNARFTALRNLVGTIKWPALIAGAGYAAQGLGTVAAGATALLSALVPLSGALAAYPALLASIGQAAGVGALAFTGVGTALSQMEKQSLGAGTAATDMGKAQEAATEGVVSAERTLTQAQQGSRLAQHALTAARHEALAELKDLKMAAIGASLGEERAAIDLREAKQELAKAENEPGHSGTEMQSLELRVREARQSLREARIASTRAEGEAHRASEQGVRHNPKVVEQRRGMNEANLQVRESSEALRKAERGVAESLVNTSSGATALATAMAKLPPAAQKFVHFLYGLKPRLDELRATAARNLLPGVESGIKAALPLFPRLNKATGETASVMGHLADKAGHLIGSKGFGRDFSSVAKSNTKIIGSLGSAGLHLADALRHVMVVAEPLTEWMAKGADGMAKWLDAEAKAGRESGSLSHFFSETRSVMESLWDTTKALAGGFFEIGKAAKPLGDEILASFNRSAHSFEDWTQSMRGRNELKEYFREAKPGIFELGRLVRDVGADFLDLSKGQGFYNLTHALRTELLPVIHELIKGTTEAFGPALVKALVQVGKLLGTLAGQSGPLTLFVESIASATKLLNGMFEHIPGLRSFVVTLAGIATVSKGLKFVGMVTGLSSAFGILKKIAATMGVIETSSAAAGLAGAGGAAVGGRAAASTVAADVGAYGEKQALREVGLLGGGSAAGAAGATWGSKAAEGFTKIVGTGAGFGATAGASMAAALLVNPDGGLLNPEKLGESPRREQDTIQKYNQLNFTKSKAQLESLEAGFEKTMHKLKTSAAVGLGGVNRALSMGLTQANDLWLHGSGKWRSHTAEAMKAAVHEIRQGMEAGIIPADQGQKEINRLLAEIHIVKGDDPFGLARGTAKQFKEANSITAGGVASWVQKLERMPKAAREKTVDSTEAMLRAWAQGHPKLEAQVEALTDFEIRKFGATNRQLQGGTARTMAHLAESAAEGATNVGAALGNIFDNLANALAAVGAQKIPHFSLTVLSAASQYHHTREETQSGLGHAPRKAGGGMTAVPGQGLQDNVPLLANGAVTAVVAPGEELMVVNRHQRPALDLAVDNTYGVGGMGGFFQSFDRPHNFAKGGEVKVAGKGAVAQLSGKAASTAQGAANAYLSAHTPKATGSAGSVNLAGVSGSVAQQAAEIVKRSRSPYRSTLALFEALWAESSMGSASPGNVLQALPPYTKIRPAAQEMAGFLTGHPTWTGTAAIPLARSTGLPSHAIAQLVQKSGVGEGNEGRANYLVAKPLALNTMRQLGLRTFANGGILGAARDGNPFNPRVMRGGPSAAPAYRRGETGFKPQTIGRIKSKARSIGNSFTGYVWGGGHGEGTHVTANGLDCSGAVAKLVQESGWEDFAVAVSTDYANRFHSGTGDKFTIWSNPEHTFVDIEGRQWGTYDNSLGYHTHTHSGFSPSHPILAPETGAAAAPGGPAPKVTKPDIPDKAKYHFKFASIVPGGFAESRGKVPTERISIPSTLPENLHDVRKELGERRWQLRKYGAALRQAKDPDVKKALGENVKAIKDRIAKLLEQQAKLLAKRKKDRIRGKIGKRGEYPDIAATLGADETSFNRAAEYASQVVGLEPETLSEAYAGQESSAFSDELRTEAVWRNHLLTADATGTGREAAMQQQIANIEALKDSHPKAWKKQKYRIPILKDAIAASQQTREEWRETLGDVQGPFGPREVMGELPTDPQPGVFGGSVFDTQMAMRDLGLRVADAVKAAAEAKEQEEAQRKAEENELLKARNAELEREAAVHRAQEPVLADYLGMKLAGGRLPKDGYYFGHRGEEVVRREDAAGGSQVHVLEPHIHVSDELAPYIRATIEQRFDEGGQTVGLGLSTPSAAGQRASMNGGS